MSKSIAVLGAGPGLGQAVARRYGREGYAVGLIARRRESLDKLADSLTNAGASAHAIPADLADPVGIPALVEQIRARVGEPDAIYYGPTAGTLVPVSELTAEHVHAVMPSAVYSLLALVEAFLPRMREQRDGAIMVATGASAVRGMRNVSGPGPALAAQRNYLQSLEAELADTGVYVGRLYIGAAIEGSAWHARLRADEAAGRSTRGGGPTVDPGELADLLWTMHHSTRQPESVVPDGILDGL